MKKIMAMVVAGAMASSGCASQGNGATPDEADSKLPPKAEAQAFVRLLEECPSEHQNEIQNSPALLAIFAPILIEGLKQGASYLIDSGVKWLKERERKHSSYSTAVSLGDNALYGDANGYLRPNLGCIVFFRGVEGDKPEEPQIPARQDFLENVARMDLYAEFKVEQGLKVPWQPVKDDSKLVIDIPLTMRIRPLMIQYLTAGTELGTGDEKQLVFDVKLERLGGFEPGAVLSSTSFDFGKMTAGEGAVKRPGDKEFPPASAQFTVPVPTLVDVTLPQWPVHDEGNPARESPTNYSASVVDPIFVSATVTVLEVGKGGQVEKFIAKQVENYKDKGLEKFGAWIDEMYAKYQKAQQPTQ